MIYFVAKQRLSQQQQQKKQKFSVHLNACAP